jgi:hypothetical protein
MTEKWLVEEVALDGKNYTYEYDSFKEANDALVKLREGSSVLTIKKKPTNKLLVEG